MLNTDLKRTAPPLPQGRRQVFKGGGLDPRYDKRGGGGGGVSASGPIRKAGGGGGEGVLSALGSIRKARGGRGVRGCVLYTSGTIRKAGGLRSRRRGGTLQSIE